ncbi:hypothetical protein CEXT_106851 [Caerostris extrusa]|uniref:Uncharacterized protein n=1 Tax=Caerostris extrusa TaxID=172846 RepID=A0AAV4SKP8_CAEEX|nr:hypothetical protein CEXT_106851 [Caerostris extrusa]
MDNPEVPNSNPSQESGNQSLIAEYVSGQYFYKYSCWTLIEVFTDWPMVYVLHKLMLRRILFTRTDYASKSLVSAKRISTCNCIVLSYKIYKISKGKKC